MSNSIEERLFSVGAEDEGPVYYRNRKIFGRKIWYFKRYEDVKSILSNHELFTNHRNKTSMNWLENLYEAYDNSFLTFVDKSLDYLDPPDHTRVRRVVNRAFTQERMKAMQPYVQEVADNLLDDLDQRDGAELLNDYAFPLTIRVLAKVLGFPEADYDWLLRLSKAMQNPKYRLRNFIFFYKYSRHLREIYTDRDGNPNGDVLSMLVDAEKNGEITNEEALHTFHFFTLAGFVTTANFITKAILALLLHAEDMKKNHNIASVTGDAIEELLRYCNVVSAEHVRWPARDVKVGGVEVKRGEMIVAMLAAANHDPAIYDNSNLLDMERTINPHMAFGHGVHFCIGATLTRMEGKIGLDSIILRFPKLRLAVGVEELAIDPGGSFKDFAELPVRWD